jgi:salicylate hydroxylase
MKWAIHTVKPLWSFVSNRVALIGDAAHAMAPHQGAGAGQSIEDAYVLPTLLGHSRTTLNTIPRALTIYDTVRQPFANKVAEQSRLNCQYFTFYSHDHDHHSGGDVLREK